MTLQDHINKFNQLVCQLLNADEKISDQEQALLLLALLPKSYRLIVQTLLVGREKIILEEAINGDVTTLIIDQSLDQESGMIRIVTIVMRRGIFNVIAERQRKI